MAYSNFKPTIWSKKIQLELDKFMVFKDICNTKFQGEVGRGKTVKIIGVARPTVKTYTPGTAIATAETPTDNSLTLAVDQYKYTNFMVDDVDQAQADVEIMTSLVKGSASALAENADSYVASLLADTDGRIAAEGGVKASAKIDTPAKAKAAIDAAFETLWTHSVKTGKDTTIVVTPWFYTLFKNSLTELLTNNVEMVEKGILGMYNGSKVVMSNNVYNDGTDDFIGVVQKDAIAFASGIEETEAYRPESLFSDAMKVLHTFGAKVVRPEQIVVMKVHA